MAKQKNAADVVRFIRPGQRVFVHGAAATPTVLLGALAEQADRLQDVELIHLHTEGPAACADPSLRNSFRTVNLFVGANVRSGFDFDNVDYLPMFLSEIPAFFRSRRRPLDVALLHLSPPDRHGYCTLGTSVDVARAACETADIVLAQINHRMPRVHGDGFISLGDVDHYVEIDEPLPEPAKRPPGDVERAIGRFVAGVVEDGACLQIGIGAIPDAVLAALHGHRHLGVHSEMWSDGVLELIRTGVVDNSRKTLHRGRTVSGFLMGSRAVYDFVDDNPAVVQFGIDHVNRPEVVAANASVTAINSAVEIDLTGQVCADSVGHRIISGVGGQMDFMRGAVLSAGGKPIIALPSRTKHGAPRIVAELQPGAGVVTTRGHVHFVATEYGIVNLEGLTLGERARALIGIAHPDDREALSCRWHEVTRSGR